MNKNSTLFDSQQVAIAHLYNVLGVPMSARECPAGALERSALIWVLSERAKQIE